MRIPVPPQVSLVEQQQASDFRLPPVGTLFMPRFEPGKHLNKTTTWVDTGLLG